MTGADIRSDGVSLTLQPAAGGATVSLNLPALTLLNLPALTLINLPVLPLQPAP